jgi:heterodisulfide reductase subunit C2
MSVLAYKPKDAKSFLEQVMEDSHQNLSACYQCKKCAAGCSVGDETGNLTPDRLIRMIVMGDKKGALENKLVWKCVSCYTCGTRCPNDIQTGKITEALKRIAKKENAEVCDPKVQNFHEAFTGSAVRWGRLNEVEFMGFYQLKNSISDMKRKDVGAIFDELMTQTKMLIPMLSKKRMHFGFQSSKGRDEIKRLMKKGFKK